MRSGRHLPVMRLSVTFFLLLLVGGHEIASAQQRTAPRPTPQQLISRAAEALGGAAALDSVRNKVVEFNTAAFSLGQEETPLSPARANFLFGKTVTDYAGKRQVSAQEVRVTSGQVNRQRRVILPTMSLFENNAQLQMDPASVSAGLERAMSLQIERIVLAAVNHASVASVVRPRIFRGEMADGARLLLGPDTLTLWFDRTTGLPLAMTTLRDDAVLGDRETLTWFTRWQDAGGVKLPRQIDVEVNGRLQTHTVIGSAAINQTLDASQFVIPDSMAAKAPRPPATPTGIITVTLEELAPGVWRAAGGSHHSLVVEQGTGLLVIEGPQSAARSTAVLDTLRNRFPGRPVTGVVMTHHHHDHSGGIRTYQANGIRVIAHERNAAFVRGIATTRKRVAPDAISRGRPTPPVMSVRDSMVLGTGAGRVVLYSLPNTHAEGLLAAWVPSAGLLFTSDVLGPGANQSPPRGGSLEMVAFARARGITPTRFTGGHGVTVDWSAVETAAR
jgi:glyoxylase-like metal-dependent hydrolase (beta-lactamase superfamily II)